jgi:AcrR family transcriptional regulator
MDVTESLPGRRERRKQEIRNRIEAAAYELFREHGIEDTSIESICATADVARRTFYGHYPNKQALLQALSYQRVWFTADDMMHRIVEEQADTPARVTAMIDYMEENLSNYGETDRALILISPGSLEEGNHLREVSDSLVDYLADLFEQGQREGDTSTDFSPELLANLVMGTINMLVVHWATNPDYPISERLEEARRLFESSIRPG